MSRSETASAAITIGAPPGIVWTTIANVDSLAIHSPETYEIERSSDHGSDVVGARFIGHNRNDRHSWATECVISTATAPTTFAFDVAPEPDGGYATRWTYTLATNEMGTTLTETFSSPLLGDKPSEMNADRYRILIEMMEATLISIKSTIENTSSTSSPCPPPNDGPVQRPVPSLRFTAFLRPRDAPSDPLPIRGRRPGCGGR